MQGPAKGECIHKHNRIPFLILKETQSSSLHGFSNVMGMLKFTDKLRNWIRAINHIDEIDIALSLLTSEDSKVMVDVGAHQGGSLRHFADAGWVVHAFEPDPRNMERLVEHWGGNSKIHLNACAVGALDAEKISFTISSNSYIGSLTAFDSSHVSGIEVPLTTLATYVEKHNIREIDFLKVDAEGHDLEVLRSLNWDALQPRLIMSEFEDCKLNKTNDEFKLMADFLVEKGYSLIVSEWKSIVSYEGPFSWRRYFPYPGKTPDKNGNGNILAVQSQSDFQRLRKLFARKSFNFHVVSKMREAYSWLKGSVK